MILHQYCAAHCKPEKPYHTAEHWWLKLYHTGTPCEVCGADAVWMKLDYAVRQDQAEAA